MTPERPKLGPRGQAPQGREVRPSPGDPSGPPGAVIRTGVQRAPPPTPPAGQGRTYLTLGWQRRLRDTAGAVVAPVARRRVFLEGSSCPQPSIWRDTWRKRADGRGKGTLWVACPPSPGSRRSPSGSPPNRKSPTRSSRSSSAAAPSARRRPRGSMAVGGAAQGGGARPGAAGSIAGPLRTGGRGTGVSPGRRGPTARSCLPRSAAALTCPGGSRPGPALPAASQGAGSRGRRGPAPPPTWAQVSPPPRRGGETNGVGGTWARRRPLFHWFLPRHPASPPKPAGEPGNLPIGAESPSQTHGAVQEGAPHYLPGAHLSPLQPLGHLSPPPSLPRAPRRGSGDLGPRDQKAARVGGEAGMRAAAVLDTCSEAGRWGWPRPTPSRGAPGTGCAPLPPAPQRTPSALTDTAREG